MLGFVLSVFVPWSIQFFVEIQVRVAAKKILSRDSARIERGISELRSWRRMAGLDRLVVQITLQVAGQAVGRFVPAASILVQRLHDDPIKLFER